MPDYPRMIAAAGTVGPVPRRIRGLLGGKVVFDTTKALYVWEWPNYPQYYIPLADVDQTMLIDEDRVVRSRRGIARGHLNRTDVDFTHLVPTDTVTSCPYKGNTSGYWSVRAGAEVHSDLAWTYDFPTRQLLPIAGLIAFYNEKVDICLDGTMLES